jgi:3-hydroxyacyl-CoA dehydrogenase/enoyl-CoA hydratase/3-hydroxybutyryl-CoA epimerase
LLDEVGLDIAAHAAASLEAAYGERMKSGGLVARMLELGLKGKKGGAGFYVYSKEPRRGRPQRDALEPRTLALVKAPGSLAMPEVEITERLIGALIAEAQLCLAEKVVASERDVDLATVFGIGFPPFRGGLMRYAAERRAK